MSVIFREDAIEAITNYAKFLWDNYYERCNLADLTGMIDVIEALPTAERVGKWVKAEKGGEWWYACSMCEGHIPKTLWGQDWHSSYCPNCGARMVRGVGENDER